jgi:hypothetical protein
VSLTQFVADCNDFGSGPHSDALVVKQQRAYVSHLLNYLFMFSYSLTSEVLTVVVEYVRLR